MTKTIFVTATGTNIGKTYSVLKIMELLAKKGIRAIPFKPIETGVASDPEDASALLQKYIELYRDETLSLDDVCLYRFELPASPYVASGGADIDIESIGERLDMLKNRADVVLMEGAGGLMVPIKKDFFMLDLMKRFADFALLISHTGLGCINDALLSKKVLDDTNIPCRIVFNRIVGDGFDEISKPFLKESLGFVFGLDDLQTVLDGVI
jgi:dethiobiotin synthetase